MVFSNFLKLNSDTTIDFKKNGNIFNDIFISFNDDKDNIIFAKQGYIKSNSNNYVFQLSNGFKLSIDGEKKMEKLEFQDYVLRFENSSISEFNNYDRNSATIYDDLKKSDYLNISYKFIDIVISIFIIYFFYRSNLLNLNFNFRNNIFFIFNSIFLLIVNQLLKNSDVKVTYYIIIISLIMLSYYTIINFKTKYE